MFGERGARAATAMNTIVDGCKVLGFRLARRRTFDTGPVLASLGDAWVETVAALGEVLA
jgi:hypothetical protein